MQVLVKPPSRFSWEIDWVRLVSRESLLGLHPNELGLMTPQREAIPADLDLDRIAQRGITDHFDVSSHQKPHLQQTPAVVGRHLNR
jgi:hypothetical protein